METARNRTANGKRPGKDAPGCKTRGREATMEKLLMAGVRVFSTYGYDGATTRLVAKEAGINESLINRYFEGKAGLLLAIIKAYLECEKGDGPWARYPEGATVEEDFRNFFSAAAEHQKERKELIKIFLSRAMVDTKVRDELKNIKKDGAPASVLEHVQKFQKRGLIRRDVNARQVAATLSGVGFGMGFVNQIVLGVDATFVQDTLSAFARDYARGIAP